MKYRLSFKETVEYQHDIEVEFDGDFEDVESEIDEFMEGKSGSTQFSMDDIVSLMKKETGFKSIIFIEDQSGDNEIECDDITESEEGEDD